VKKLPEKTMYSSYFGNAKLLTEEGAKNKVEEKGGVNAVKKMEEVFVKYNGVELAVREEIVLFALYTLGTENGFKDPGGSGYILRFKPADLCRATGMEAGENFSFDSRERKKMTQSLSKLMREAVDIVIPQLVGEDKKTGEKKYNMLIKRSALVREITLVFRDLTTKKVFKRAWGITTPDNAKLCGMEVEISKYLVIDLEKRFWAIPSSLPQDVRKTALELGYKKTSLYDILFIQWLFQQQKKRRVINRYKLANTLKLGDRIKKSDWKRIDKVLKRAYRMAIKLGYLEKVALYEKQKEDSRHSKNKYDVFILNEEKFEHLKIRKISSGGKSLPSAEKENKD